MATTLNEAAIAKLTSRREDTDLIIGAVIVRESGHHDSQSEYNSNQTLQFRSPYILFMRT